MDFFSTIESDVAAEVYSTLSQNVFNLVNFETGTTQVIVRDEVLSWFELGSSEFESHICDS